MKCAVTSLISADPICPFASVAPVGELLLAETNQLQPVGSTDWAWPSKRAFKVTITITITITIIISSSSSINNITISINIISIITTIIITIIIIVIMLLWLAEGSLETSERAGFT